jgi:hypothetical protein
MMVSVLALPLNLSLNAAAGQHVVAGVADERHAGGQRRSVEVDVEVPATPKAVSETGRFDAPLMCAPRTSVWALALVNTGLSVPVESLMASAIQSAASSTTYMSAAGAADHSTDAAVAVDGVREPWSR